MKILYCIMKRKIIKVGSSWAISIPPAILELLNIKGYDECNLEVNFEALPEKKQFVITFKND